MTGQIAYCKSYGRLVFVSAAIALLATMATNGEASATTHSLDARSTVHCATGYVPTVHVIRKAGKRRRVVVCRRGDGGQGRPPGSSSTPASPAASNGTPSAAPAAEARPIAVPSVEPPLISAPTSTPPIEISGPEIPGTETAEPETPGTETPEPEDPPVPVEPGVQVRAAIAKGFSQDPSAPNEVTWRYSASATRTVTEDGVDRTEPIPLPEGRLVFYVDGQLDCEILAGGAIYRSACTVPLRRLGTHEVEAIFSGAASDSVSRTDSIGRYPTSTSLQASVEPVAPEYLNIGTNKYGYEVHAFEIGRLRIIGSTTPGGYPVFDCEGQAPGCLEPEVSLANHRGSVSVPLYSMHVYNLATEREEWRVGFPAYSPSLREEGWFWQFPSESVGKEFFHVVSESEPGLYEPSSATVPLDLNGGHYPFYRWMRSPSESGGSIAAVEGVPQKVLTIGTYEKFGGPEEWLEYRSSFWTVASESKGCRYRLRIDGQNTWGGAWEPDEGRRVGFNNGTAGESPGPHTFSLWVERAIGAGPGNCAVESGSLEAFEATH